MLEWMIFAFIGVLSGLASGLLGLGGGVIIVPALLLVFNWQGLLGPHLMHMAVATSLMTIIVTSSTSAYSHHKHDNIDWRLLKRLAPGLVVGGMLGAVLGSYLSSQYLQQFFVFYLLFSAIKIWLPLPSAMDGKLINNYVLMGFGSIVGTISSLIGIGGGTLIVPYLVMANKPIQRAIGTSATCGVPISIAAVTSFILFCNIGKDSTSMSTVNLIQWPAFLGIISTSSVFAIIGSGLAKRLPKGILKGLFSIILLLVSLYMFKGGLSGVV